MFHVVFRSLLLVILYVSCSGLIISVWEERASYFFCYYMVYVVRGFLFLLVLGTGCVILLWHSQGLPYNYFADVLGLKLNTTLGSVGCERNRKLCLVHSFVVSYE